MKRVMYELVNAPRHEKQCRKKALEVSCGGCEGCPSHTTPAAMGFLYGVYAAIVYVPIHNWLTKRVGSSL